ncbi:MAG: IspD/TarI family cytidylyltransferase [bacterium]|nr:IspD/TarI family cytidylyltransferase [bacterium]
MKISCCIVAAGQGARLGKQYKGTWKALIPVLGRPMLYYSMNAFDSAGEFSEGKGIDQFVIAVPPGSIGKFKDIISAWGFSRPVTLVEGGETRADSVRNALSMITDDPPEMVMVHDCARVCVTPEMVELMLRFASETNETGVSSATLAHRSVDTLRIDSEGHIAGEVDRESIACVETPQIFPYGRLLELHETCGESDCPTDDTTLFTRADEKVKLIFHDGSNMKITYPEDIGMAEGVLFHRGWLDAHEGED